MMRPPGVILKEIAENPVSQAIARRWHPIYRILLVALSTALLTWLHINMPDKGPDFTVLWAAAGHVFEPVYDIAYITSLQPGLPGPRPFAYPPPFLLMLAPVGFLPFKVAYVAWCTAAMVAFVEAGMRVTRFGWLVLFSPTLIFVALIGQTTLIVGALAIAGLMSLDRPRRAGFAIGVALCIKPQLLLLVPVLLFVDRRWRVLLFTGLTGMALSLAATIILGPHIWLDWLRALPEFMAVNDKLGIERLGVTGWLRPAVLIVAILFLIRAIRRKDRPRMMLVALGGSIVLAPHAVFYESVIVLPAAIALIGLSLDTIPALVLLLGIAETPIAFMTAAGLLASGWLSRWSAPGAQQAGLPSRPETA
jgi:hypothetical protein